MKKILVMGLGLALVGTLAAHAEVIISSGAKSKTFYNIASNISGLLPNTQVLTSKGSLENLENLKSGKANVALTFADAYKGFIDKNPEMRNNTSIIGTAGYGCLYAAVLKTGKVQSEDDLQNSDVRVAIGKRGAGSNATWEYMGTLDKGYKAPQIEYSGDNLALGKLKSGTIDAVLQMQNPSVHNAIVKAVNASEDLKFVDINDYSLNNKLPDGMAIYEYKDIVVKKGFVNSTVETICSPTLIVVSNELDEEAQEALADVIINKQSSVMANTGDK